MRLWSFHHWAGRLYSLLFPTEREKNIHRGKYIEMNFRVHEQRRARAAVSPPPKRCNDWKKTFCIMGERVRKNQNIHALKSAAI